MGRTRSQETGGGGESTRQRLLDAAEQLFAARGFVGTSVRDISQAASCNLAAVSYHFGSKLGLYSEVFRHRFGALREERLTRLRGLSGQPGGGSLEEVLRVFATAFLEPLVDESRGRTITELMGREMLDPQLPAEEFWREMVGPVQQSLVEGLRAVVPELDEPMARLCALAVVAQLVQAAQRARHARMAAAAARRPPLDPKLIVEHVVRFSAGGVRACAGSSPSQPVGAGHPGR